MRQGARTDLPPIGGKLNAEVADPQAEAARRFSGTRPYANDRQHLVRTAPPPPLAQARVDVELGGLQGRGHAAVASRPNVRSTLIADEPAATAIDPLLTLGQVPRCDATFATMR